MTKNTWCSIRFAALLGASLLVGGLGLAACDDGAEERSTSASDSDSSDVEADAADASDTGTHDAGTGDAGAGDDDAEADDANVADDDTESADASASDDDAADSDAGDSDAGDSDAGDSDAGDDDAADSGAADSDAADSDGDTDSDDTTADSDDDATDSDAGEGDAADSDAADSDATDAEGGSVPPDLVYVPAGAFIMGSPSGELGRYTDETQHEVTLTRDFYVSDHEVTQGEFEALMGWNTSYLRLCGADCPVDYLSWYDALIYANQRSIAEGLTPCYVLSEIECERSTPDDVTPMGCMNYTQQGIDSATVTLNGVSSVYECEGYRLPTEAEWEYAARAGTTTAFHNGEISSASSDPNLDLIGRYYFNSGATSHPVGGLEPNAWGLYDVSGNVYEWVWDRYGSYGGDVTDPEGAMSGLHRVLRGGGWYHNASFCRSAYRNYYGPGNRYFYFGVRMFRTAP